MNLSDIIAINICKQGSDNIRIAICDDEVSMVQILEKKMKRLSSREEYELDWKQIAKIGDDIILVKDKYAE